MMFEARPKPCPLKECDVSLVKGVFSIYVTYESRVDVKVMSIDGEPGELKGDLSD